MGAALLSGLLMGCSSKSIYLGSDAQGYTQAPENTISPEAAAEAAAPFLEETYALRAAERLSTAGSDQPLTVHIVQKGRWYHVAADNYPFKTYNAYLEPAVRVHIETGEVLPPEE